MAKAFLSHSSTDKGLVEKIANQLGPDFCHYDNMTFDVGALALEEIEEAMEETDIFVLFISNASLNSDWVKKEIALAAEKIKSSLIDRIFPIIIERGITYIDKRIPNWIRKPYNLREFNNEVLIHKKIVQYLREVEIEKYTHVKDLSNLFVGRTDLINDFETKVVGLDVSYPSCIIAYNFIEGIGRRSFLKHSLRKIKIIDKYYEPLVIPFQSKESVEDFIFKLNFINPSEEIDKLDLSTMTLDEKVGIAKKMLQKVKKANELLFIIDEGSIILANTKIADWFEKLITGAEFKNQISICLIAKFRPDGLKIARMKNVVSLLIPPLSRIESQTLFLQYLNLLKIELESEDKKFFIKNFSGIPSQINFASQLIYYSGIIDAKKNIGDVISYSDSFAVTIFNQFKDDELIQQLLILMAKVGIVSLKIIYEIFGENDEIKNSLSKLQNISAFHFLFGGYEHLKLNSVLTDYINRSKLVLNKKYSAILREYTKKLLTNDLDEQLKSDYSEFLISIQSMIKSGDKIPSKYYIPSLVLKTLISEYYENKYPVVIKLALELLENQDKYDYQIIWEIKYWLCCAYCRQKNDKFFEELSFFNTKESKTDYYFLLGFYFRNIGKNEEAERNYFEVLRYDPYHSRTKRELVVVYIRQAKYPEALTLARDNFERYRTNILHIQAFFICLIRKRDLSQEEKENIDELLGLAEASYDKKASDISAIMKAEYEFYMNHDTKLAISLLETALKTSKNKFYAQRSLVEILKRANREDKLAELIGKYPVIDYDEEDV